jgi:hypothetical protein
MTNNDEAIETLESEHMELDIPYIGIDNAILAIGDHFGIGFDEILAAFDNASDWNAREKTTPAAKIMSILLDEAIESSLQFAHIRRGIEIARDISNLSETE